MAGRIGEEIVKILGTVKSQRLSRGAGVVGEGRKGSTELDSKEPRGWLRPSPERHSHADVRTMGRDRLTRGVRRGDPHRRTRNQGA